jgi:hypothetical protein
MTATPADIAAGTRPAAIAAWSSSAILTRYPSARDGAAEPAEGLFDALADAVTAITQRGELLGVERRRFVVKVAGLLWELDEAAGIPVVELIDSEQSVSDTFLVTRYELDLEAEMTTLELFG